MKRLPLAAIILAMMCSTVSGDTPLLPPARVEVESANKAFKVISHPKNGTECIDTKSKKILWTLPGWFRWSFIADDGEHYVTGYDGMNLIPQNHTDDLVLLTFWKNGTKIRDVTLGEIIPNKKTSQKTVSHYHWGVINGFMPNGLLKITRADESILLYEPETAKAVDR